MKILIDLPENYVKNIEMLALQKKWKRKIWIQEVLKSEVAKQISELKKPKKL